MNPLRSDTINMYMWARLLVIIIIFLLIYIISCMVQSTYCFNSRRDVIGIGAGVIYWAHANQYSHIDCADGFNIEFQLSQPHYYWGFEIPSYPGQSWRILPVWMPGLGIAMGLWIVLARRKSIKITDGVCQSCGYDTRGIGTTCPECGSTALSNPTK